MSLKKLDLGKFWAVLFVLVILFTAAVPSVSANAADHKNSKAGYSYSRQSFYGKPYIFEIAWNIPEQEEKSYGRKKVSLSDKAAMNVWYADGLKKDMSDKNVTAALAEVLNYIGSNPENPELVRPIVLNIENVGDDSPETLVKRYYKNDDIARYKAVLPFADSKTRQAYLKKAYNDYDTAFFSVSLDVLGNVGLAERYLAKAYADDNTAFFSICFTFIEDSDSKKAGALVDTYAEKAYTDGEIAFFAVIADRMDGDTAEEWLSRAKKDKKIAFELIFDDKWDDFDDDWDDWDDWDDFNDDWDDFDDDWDDYENYINSSDYAKYGITYKGGHYYCNGEPVRYFLDIQRSGSPSVVATVETNPKGKADIKVVRDRNGNITGVKKLTEKEIKKYFGDTED